MPPLKRPDFHQYLMLPPRPAQLAGKTQVLIVGGGPAGIGAALGAAKAGAKVILVERYGFLGGNATAALVMPLMSFYTQTPVERESVEINLFPQDNGPGKPAIKGVLAQFLTKLIKAGGAIRPSLKTGYVVPFDPEIFKLTALEMLEEAGIQFLFHAFASDLYIERKKVKGVVFSTKSGPLVIEADMIVDCTGDGDIAAMAGAPYELGRDMDGLVQPMTLMFRLAGFEKIAFGNYAKEHPEDWKHVHGLWNLIKLAADRGELNLPREDILFFGAMHDGELSVNSTRITKVMGTDVWDLSYAEWVGRKQMKQIQAFLKKYVPGFNQSYILQSGVQVGVRETRRILGDYQLTAADILGAKKFADVIAHNAYPVDIHNPKGVGTILRRLPPGEFHDIPLRSLIPQKTENILVAGRCISGTHEAHSSYRVMPVSMATGQAAGVCAAIASKHGLTTREVAVSLVQAELLNQGAELNRAAEKITAAA